MSLIHKDVKDILLRSLETYLKTRHDLTEIPEDDQFEEIKSSAKPGVTTALSLMQMIKSSLLIAPQDFFNQLEITLGTYKGGKLSNVKVVTNYLVEKVGFNKPCEESHLKTTFTEAIGQAKQKHAETMRQFYDDHEQKTKPELLVIARDCFRLSLQTSYLKQQCPFDPENLTQLLDDKISDLDILAVKEYLSLFKEEPSQYDIDILNGFNAAEEEAHQQISEKKIDGPERIELFSALLTANKRAFEDDFLATFNAETAIESQGATPAAKKIVSEQSLLSKATRDALQEKITLQFAKIKLKQARNQVKASKAGMFKQAKKGPSPKPAAPTVSTDSSSPTTPRGGH